jgi:hypothetical protein
MDSAAGGEVITIVACLVALYVLVMGLPACLGGLGKLS